MFFLLGCCLPTSDGSKISETGALTLEFQAEMFYLPKFLSKTA